ncbi:ATP-binding protein, partial [Chloroflexota bacterium]
MAKSKIDETLKKIAENTSKANIPTSSSTKQGGGNSFILGDPDCPNCHGAGYLRRDLPVDHSDFGSLEICTCRQARVSKQVRQRLYSLSHLDELGGLTFETFKKRGRNRLGDMQADSLESAFNRAQQFAGNLKGWLFFSGGFGCGKTHLAAAIANYAVGMGVPTLFLTVPDLLDTLRFSYDSEDTSFEERFEQIRSASLLVLDDFGTQNATEWAQEKLFQIINFRYINKLPLVVT